MYQKVAILVYSCTGGVGSSAPIAASAQYFRMKYVLFLRSVTETPHLS